MGESGEVTYSPTIDLLREFTPHLWAIAFVFYGVGDLVTTAVGLQLQGIAEVGPIAALVVGYGPPAVVALKASSFLLFAAIWRTVPKPHNVGVPLALATFGVVLTTWNLAVIIVLFV
jgi:hypothetical protein